jgi:hypothetical protein
MKTAPPVLPRNRQSRKIIQVPSRTLARLAITTQFVRSGRAKMPLYMTPPVPPLAPLSATPSSTAVWSSVPWV